MGKSQQRKLNNAHIRFTRECEVIKVRPKHEKA